MDTIVDLRSHDGGHDLLTETEVGGRIRGGALLSDAPLASFLSEKEAPQFVLRNKKSGVEVDGEESTTIEPGDSYQALALVTDTRVLFVVGDDQGDTAEEVELADIVQAKSTDSGFRSTALVLETLDQRTWSFPCRGETDEVATFVDGLAQTWASAERRTEEAEDQLREGHRLVQNGEYEAAADAVSSVKSAIEAIITELRSVGPAAATHAREQTEPLANALLKLQGPIRAQLAATSHANGQDAWDAGEYERAATAYERAVGMYEQALQRETGPTTAQLRDRLTAALRERELLRVAPLAAADTARRRARNTDEPETAATQWEDVLIKYQRLLTLEWPGDGSFVATRERVQEQAAAAAEDAIDDYYEAGRRRLGSADEFSVGGREQRAEVLYERAGEQFDQARRLAVETDSVRIAEIDEAIQTVEGRLDGDMPDEHLPVEELPITEVDVTPSEQPDEPQADEEETEETDDSEYDESSVIGRIQSQKTSNGTDEETESGAEPVGVGDETVTNAELRSKLHGLDQESFTEFVADLWDAQGWSTTVFSTTNQVVYDIVAMREEPEQRRLLLWTEHRGEDEQIGPREIERCATARDSSQGADSATLVTNALLRTAAKQRADGLDVTVIDGSDLVELVRFEDFLGRLNQETIEQ